MNKQKQARERLGFEKMSNLVKFVTNRFFFSQKVLSPNMQLHGGAFRKHGIDSPWVTAFSFWWRPWSWCSCGGFHEILPHRKYHEVGTKWRPVQYTCYNKIVTCQHAETKSCSASYMCLRKNRGFLVGLMHLLAKDDCLFKTRTWERDINYVCIVCVKSTCLKQNGGLAMYVVYCACCKQT